MNPNQPPIPHPPPGQPSHPIGLVAPAQIQCHNPKDLMYKIAQKVHADPMLKQQIQERVYEMLITELNISRER
ncbi:MULTISPECIES: hypothetical protein [Arthrospira]|jgi:hypothetical protein|uniref:Uncharacterized protein n=1 Tax=Limnospira platensis NIES-46 TaxID=1236695 RepID=A0A5M3SZJ7_LIMPL|nr:MULTISPECIES: hypothetical protein [Arthrospira]AMW31389.1 hypothetical protein AP285_29205 [Arthrospira platensis YZ]KDR56123.1 hypothetical protein APPUASWS_018510 [Arthrospira platensis str. Paraca]MBD2668991.1 hypothetical protein [Arthrospira platensis FACHB-439]MBD2709428.1 hypothetical protein [Arthrospira platensis FACHB-835]MDF2208881.1 hypothetical protein [Arthrospira platensis NCB002]MDT9182081.1 hypothetical protein [Limnospira sp. PMC 289.06]MDT9294225.1 hypothetical protein